MAFNWPQNTNTNPIQWGYTWDISVPTFVCHFRSHQLKSFLPFCLFVMSKYKLSHLFVLPEELSNRMKEWMKIHIFTNYKVVLPLIIAKHCDFSIGNWPLKLCSDRILPFLLGSIERVKLQSLLILTSQVPNPLQRKNVRSVSVFNVGSLAWVSGCATSFSMRPRKFLHRIRWLCFSAVREPGSLTMPWTRGCIFSSTKVWYVPWRSCCLAKHLLDQRPGQRSQRFSR